MSKHRIQITTLFKGLENGLDKGFKTFVREYLFRLNIGCDVERIPHSADPKDFSTRILFEGVEAEVHAAKSILIKEIKKKFPLMTIPPDIEWVVEASQEKLEAAKILPTSSTIRRLDSSGAATTRYLGVVSDILESVKNVSNDMIETAFQYLPTGVLKAAGVTGKPILIHLHYKNENVSFNLAFPFLTWDLFKSECRRYLNLEADVRDVYYKRGVYVEKVLDITCFLEDQDYFILTTEDLALDVKNQFKSMDEFYAELRARGSDEEDVEIIRTIFEKERFKAGYLSSITEDDLKEISLAPVGLRKAVLSVLGK